MLKDALLRLKEHDDTAALHARPVDLADTGVIADPNPPSDEKLTEHHSSTGRPALLPEQASRNPIAEAGTCPRGTPTHPHFNFHTLAHETLQLAAAA